MAESLRELVEAVMVEERAAENALTNGNAEAWAYCCSRVQSEKIALCDALLTSRAVDAVEVLRAWGRAKVAAIDTGSALFRAEHAYEYDGGPREAWEQAGNAHLVARAAETHAESVASTLAMQMALADALAGEVDRG